jgi:hypothetical protein
MNPLRGVSLSPRFFNFSFLNMTYAKLPKNAEKSKVSDTNSRFPKRAPFEFYPTPPEATRALLSVESFEGTVWEPACGDGAISKVLMAAGYQVVSTDLIDRGFGQGGCDFLKSTEPLARNIITNPPNGTHGL